MMESDGQEGEEVTYTPTLFPESHRCLASAVRMFGIFRSSHNKAITSAP